MLQQWIFFCGYRQTLLDKPDKLFFLKDSDLFPVEVTANEPTEVIEIPKTSVLELFRKNEQFLENYMNLSANYARTLSDKLFFLKDSDLFPVGSE